MFLIANELRIEAAAKCNSMLGQEFLRLVTLTRQVPAVQIFA
jgi:hypothetical protein